MTAASAVAPARAIIPRWCASTAADRLFGVTRSGSEASASSTIASARKEKRYGEMPLTASITFVNRAPRTWWLCGELLVVGVVPLEPFAVGLPWEEWPEGMAPARVVESREAECSAGAAQASAIRALAISLLFALPTITNC